MGSLYPELFLGSKPPGLGDYYFNRLIGDKEGRRRGGRKASGAGGIGEGETSVPSWRSGALSVGVASNSRIRQARSLFVGARPAPQLRSTLGRRQVARDGAEPCDCRQ